MVLPFLIPALIAGAAGVASTALQNSAASSNAQRQTIAAAAQTKQQFKYDMERARMQRKWDAADLLEARAYDKAQLTEARQYSRDTIQRLVADAEKAGFNPLTLLRNGAGAGYAAGPGFAPLSRSMPSTPAPGRIAPMQAVPELQSPLASGVGNFLANFDPFADQTRELEYQLVQAQIENLNASSRAFDRPSFGNVPSYTAGMVERRVSGRAAALGKPGQPSPGELTVTNPWETMGVDPNVRDAAAFEERYGDSEIGSMLYGGYVAVRDAWSNMRPTFERGLKWAASKGAKDRQSAAARHSRLKRDAARNARDLGFKGY